MSQKLLSKGVNILLGHPAIDHIKDTLLTQLSEVALHYCLLQGNTRDPYRKEKYEFMYKQNLDLVYVGLHFTELYVS